MFADALRYSLVITAAISTPEISARPTPVMVTLRASLQRDSRKPRRDRQGDADEEEDDEHHRFTLPLSVLERSRRSVTCPGRRSPAQVQ